MKSCLPARSSDSWGSGAGNGVVFKTACDVASRCCQSFSMPQNIACTAMCTGRLAKARIGPQHPL